MAVMHVAHYGAPPRGSFKARLPPFILGLLVLTACARYQARPLSDPPLGHSLGTLEVQADRLSVPLLRPVSFRGGPFSPDQIALLAVAGNPALRAARDRLGLARAQVLQAGLLPNPTLGVGLSVPLGNTAGLTRGYSVGLGFDLSALLTRPLREKAARAHTRSVALEVVWAEWRVAEHAKLQALRLQALLRAATLAHRLSRQAQAQAVRMQRALATQDVRLVDADAAAAAATRARLAWLTLAMHAAYARSQLDTALGLEPGTPVPLAALGRGDPWGQVPRARVLLRHLGHRRPDLVALRFGYRSQDAALRQAILGQFPNIAIGLSRARDTTGVNTINPDVRIRLPLFNHNQGAVALARATRRVLFDTYRARVFEARAEVVHLRQDHIFIERRIRIARREVRQQQHLMAAAHRAFQRGELSAVSFFAVASQETANELALLQLERRRDAVGVGLEVASGRYFEIP